MNMIIHALCCAAGLASANALAGTFSVTVTNDNGPGSLRQALLDANANPGPDLIRFDIGSVGKSISPTNALPAITDPVTIDGTTQPGFGGTPIIELNGASAGTGTDGLRLWAGGTTIRGLVINRFSGDGIEIATNGNNVVEGCWIGLGTDGTTRRANANGIFITNSPNNTIGGATAAARNIIAGNSQAGVRIENTGARGNLVFGNLIGTDVSGTLARGNSGEGVYVLRNAFANTIGGTNAGQANVIANNGSDGIYVQNGTNNTLRANAIFANGDLGIDLGNNGKTANDAGDIDTGANQFQNFPLVTDASLNVGGTFIAGTLNSRPSTSYTLDFFSSIVCDPSTNGEGQVYLGSISVTTSADSNANFSLTLPVTAVGRFITATATDPFGNTAEFGPCYRAASALPPATFTVVNTNDAGPGSLRQAILDNNATYFGSPNTIAFAIPGTGPHTIAPASALPDITEPVTIDGFTQANAAPNTLPDGNNAVLQIRLDGAGAFGANGLRLRASGSQVRGLSITRFPGEGVRINGASNCVVAGNFIGLAPDGFARANNGSGVQVFDSPGNRIGGAAPADRNVLSGNFTAGVHLLGVGASNNVVEGNFIGTSPDGAAARANFVNGIYVQDAPRNRIGGTTPGARNVISGNTPDGIRISGSESVGNVVFGNFIGPRANGTVGLGSQNGVNLESGASNRVGGSAAGEGNVISGNSGFGLRIDFLSSGNLVLGNRIGVGPTGGALSNGAQGILIRGSNNRLGGAAPGEGNEIANNAPGIEVELGTGNAIRGNSIHDNRPRFAVFGGLGIDLGVNGLTANDPGDGDGGPNLSQNFPKLTAATASGASTRVQGTLNSRASAPFALDFFSNPDCDASGNGEGFKYLGTTSVTTDSGGNASFEVTLSVAAEGRQIAATATDADGNTSEFSPCFAASVVQPPQTFFVTNTNDSGPGSLRQALLDAQASPASANNVVAFDIPGTGGGREAGGAVLAAAGAGKHVIRLETPLDSLYEAVTIDGFSQLGAVRNSLPNGNNANWTITLNGSRLGVGANGLTLSAPGCIVEGLEVTGFRGNGIKIDESANISVVRGCNIQGNQLAGVSVGGTLVVIGGRRAADRNVIHGNGVGIEISGATAINNLIEGNFIGLDTAGSGNGNFGEGVNILNSANGNQIGGTAPGAGNHIAFNLRSGVTVFNGTGNAIIGNSIFGNVGLGIELFPGANGDVAAPTITAATILANGVQCAGTFAAGQPNGLHTFHAYSSREPDGNGELFLGEGTANADASGAGSFNFTAPGSFTGRHLTITVTKPDGSTSKFSDSLTPDSERPPSTFTVTTTADDGLGSLRQALKDADNYLAADNNLIAFNIPGGGVRIIQPLTPLTLPEDPITIDGLTQPGSQPNTQTDEGYDGVHLIQLDGALQGGGPAFSATAGRTIFRGLSITRFGSALQLGGAGENVVRGCLIGLNPAFQPAGNTGDGVEITSPNNRVGGADPEDHNVIGANGGSGSLVITRQAGHNEFHGNLFGFMRNPNPAVPANRFFNNLGNREDGIRFRFGASDNRVGGPILQHRNFFGFNTRDAVSVESGQRNHIFNNVFLTQPVPTTTDDFIALGPGANDNILPPTLDDAHSDSVNLRFGVRYTGQPNTTYQAEFYVGDKVAGAPWDLRLFRPIHQFNLTTDGSGNASQEETVAELREVFARGFAMLSSPLRNSSAASRMVKVIPAGSADLKTQLFVQPLATNGIPITVTIVVTNCGPATATNVIVALTDGWSLEVVDIPAPGQPGTNEIYYTVGDLPPGEARTLTATLRPTKTGPQQKVATATQSGQDPNLTNNKEAVLLQIVEAENAPKADIETQVSMPVGDFNHGDLVTFTFRISNKGPNHTSGVQALIELLGVDTDPIIESISAPPGVHYTVTGSDVACTVDNLFDGGSVEIQVRARVFGKPDVDAGVTAGIKAWSGIADPDTFNNSDFDGGVTVPATPLAIKEADNGYRVSWPAPSPNTELQSTTSLTQPASWTAVPASSIVTADGANTHAVNPRGDGAPPAQFYRLAEKGPTEPQAEFNQLSLDLDGVRLPFTDWGQLALRLPLSNAVRYVNLAVNGNWVIQNAPILSGLSGGVADRVWLNFPLGTNGVPVFTASTGFTVTTNLATTAPLSTNLTFIGNIWHHLASGEQEFRVTYTPAQRVLFGLPLRFAQARPGFPNREQGTNECAPASIVNSLEYLNGGFDLGLPAADISLEAIKQALGWTEDIGAPVGDDLQNAEWVQAKAQHMRDRNLPIVTETTTNASVALDAVAAGHDVEIRMTGHVACVVGITEMPLGLWSLDISHDTRQGDPNGGRVVETVLLNSSTGQLTGTTWGNEFIQFIIERPGP
jgi:hypothetical protein